MENTSQDMVEQLRKHNEKILQDLLKDFRLRRSNAKLEKKLKSPMVVDRMKDLNFISK